MPPNGRTPDDSQERVIKARPVDRLLVEAGPGYGKTDVACARVAHLLAAGIPASRIVLLTFTRTAVRELRDRIAALTVPGTSMNGVEVRTLDSFAWRLRRGLVDAGIVIAGNGYEQTFIALNDVLGRKRTDPVRERLWEYLAGRQHVLVDEAQ